MRQKMERMRELVREGRFQRSLALMTAGASLMSGVEVAYEHYRGSYSRRVMYTPVMLSAGLTGAALAGFFSRRAAHTWLRYVSALMLADGGLGFYFHIRGIARKPGGWRLPMVNLVMGPPLFAPLLFGISAYLGLIASYLRREDDGVAPAAKSGQSLDARLIAVLPRPAARKLRAMETAVGHGRFQGTMAAAAGISSLLSGLEAFYSHYKNNFQYKAQWTPIVLSPLLAAAAFAAMRHRKTAVTLLPALSLLACADAGLGFYYHARGVLRRPGGGRHWIYNILYGPPIFAPLLFGAAGFLGVMASLLQPSKKRNERRRAA